MSFLPKYIISNIYFTIITQYLFYENKENLLKKKAYFFLKKLKISHF